MTPNAPSGSRHRSVAKIQALTHRLWRFARTRLGAVLLSLFALIVLGSLWLVWPYLRAGGDIRSGLDHQPSRLWGAGETVAVGDALSAQRLAERLEGLGYRSHASAQESGEALPPQRYRRSEGALILRLPELITPEGRRPRRSVTIRLAQGAVAGIEDEKGNAIEEEIFLGAPLLASYYGDDVREIYPVEIDELPDHVIDAVLSAEDDGFYFHAGVSPSGIARAAIVNAKEGEVRQGGSTITQQLIKNVFLSHDRSLTRKIREAVLSLLVEVAHTKESILQAYFNQIYLGTGHRLNIHGLGAAARHYFGVDARDLSVSQAAVLAGMIRSPGSYSPLAHPEAARERRDQVLRAMAENKLLEPEQLAAALAEPIAAVGVNLGSRRASYFADAMAEEASVRFGIKTLGDRGYHLFTSLDLGDQLAAEQALERTLKRLPARSKLQGALVSADPRDGSIKAWVGGRDYGESEFDRVRSARRQAGSAFKPVVLATALAAGFSPSHRLDDSPLSVRSGGSDWEPRNSDGKFRGPVTLRRTIEDSLNVPAVRLAEEVGLGEVTAMARLLGIESRLEKLPSVALGAFELSPLELATVYATLANQGEKPLLHGITSLTTARGRRVGDPEPPSAERVLDPAIAYQMTSILRGVIDRGTGRGAKGYRVAGKIAGKTGTSNEAKDNWFAAYRSDRVTVVWVGHDDPQSTSLSGSRAALPVWGRYAAASYPSEVPEDPPVPAGIAFSEVCRDSGLLPLRACPTRIDEAFIEGQSPTEACDLHVPGREPKRRKKPISWLKRKLGKIFD